jgi:hypothetical protein
VLPRCFPAPKVVQKWNGTDASPETD